MTNLSTHFTLEELTHSQTATRLGIENNPNDAELVNLRRLAETLERIRTAVGKPIQITSGYRCKALNERVGGSKTSAHMDGRAADIVVAGLTPIRLARAIREAGIVLDQLIYEGEWIHVGIPLVGEKSRGDVMTAVFEKGGVRYMHGLIPQGT